MNLTGKNTYFSLYRPGRSGIRALGRALAESGCTKTAATKEKWDISWSGAKGPVWEMPSKTTNPGPHHFSMRSPLGHRQNYGTNIKGPTLGRKNKKADIREHPGFLIVLINNKFNGWAIMGKREGKRIRRQASSEEKMLASNCYELIFWAPHFRLTFGIGGSTDKSNVVEFLNSLQTLGLLGFVARWCVVQ